MVIKSNTEPRNISLQQERSHILARYLEERKEYNERGNVLIWTIFLVVVLCAFIGLTYDVGMAYMKRTSMETVANILHDTNLDVAILTRNSKTPGYDIAKNLTDLARENNYNGEISVTFYELSPQERADVLDPYYRRVWVVDIQLHQESPTLFMSMFGIKSLPLNVELLTGDTNESSEYVWFPDGYKNSDQYYCGKWHTSSGQDFDAAHLDVTQADYPCPAGGIETIKDHISTKLYNYVKTYSE